MRIRGYEASDLEACRRLWVELTDWHRRLYDSPGIGGERAMASRLDRSRNDIALQFFHGLGFDALGQLELIADLRSHDEQHWRAGPSLAGRTFRV